MRIIGRSENLVRASVREAVRLLRRQNQGLTGDMVGAAHSSGGFVTTWLDGATTRKKWVVGDSLANFTAYR